jgi:hypothetical protein
MIDAHRTPRGLSGLSSGAKSHGSETRGGSLGDSVLLRYETNARNEKIYGEGKVTQADPPLLTSGSTRPSSAFATAEETILLNLAGIYELKNLSRQGNDLLRAGSWPRRFASIGLATSLWRVPETRQHDFALGACETPGFGFAIFVAAHNGLS